MRLALLVLLAALVGEPQVPASLSGYVLERISGRPIGGADVSIDFPQGLSPRVSVKTEANGHFRFDGIRPGSYPIFVSKQGYFSFNSPFGGRRITVGAGEDRNDLVLRLQGTGTVSGRVLDANGRPAVGVNVQIFAFTFRDLQREPSGVDEVASRPTNDKGEFPVFNIPAGQYFVAANPPSTIPRSANGATLYPGVSETRNAQRIEVQAERETALRDFALPLAMPGAIRLRIVNATGAPLPARINLDMAPVGWPDSSGSSVFTSIEETAPGTNTGVRIFRPALLGAYVFHTAFQTAAGNIAGYARADYSGGDVDVDFVLVPLSAEIKGHVLLEVSDGSTKALAGAEIEFHGVDTESAFSSPEGSFAIKGLLNGPYQFSGAFELPKGYYVSSVRERDRDLLKETLLASQTMPEVEVRVRADGGLLGGKVLDRRNRAVDAATVTLVPQGLLDTRSDRHNTYRTEQSSATGAFELSDIIPGDYLIYAWANISEVGVMDPRFLEMYKGKGLPVTVERGAKLKMDLTILDE